MTMSFSYYTPDPTGVSADYKNSSVEYLFRTGQKVSFPVPVFASSITAQSLGIAGVTLTAGNDWTYSESDYADEAMSRAKNVDSSFSDILINSITITRSTGQLPLQAQFFYQQFYLTTPDVPVVGGSGGLELTPDLIASMLESISSISAKQTTITDTTAPTSATPVLLDYDINCENAANVITDEVHQVNTYNGVNTIRPVNGAFFKDGLALSVGGTALTLDVDYTVASCNIALTALSTNRSGIYNLIHVISDVTDAVELTYHPVGGTPTNQAISAIATSLDSVIQYLNNAQFMTESTLRTSTVVTTLARSINNLETKTMRALNPVPTYGDSSTGTTVVKAIAATDYGVHWYTFGTLYKVSGSDYITVADRMKVRVRLDGAKYQCDLAVSVDITNTRNPVTITAENVVWDNGMTLYGSISTVAPMVPMCRVLWRNTTSGTSGIIFQLGFSLPGLTDRLAIEDYSGVESACLLDKTTGSGSPIYPSDTNITMPDGSLWNATDTLSQSFVQTLQSSDGHVLFGGTSPFTAFDSSSSGGSVVPYDIYLPSYTDLTKLKSIDVHTASADGTRFVTNLRTVLSADGTKLIASGTILLDTSTDVTGILTLTIDTTAWTITPKILGLSSIVDQFQLRYLVGNF